ncbi:MAG: hydrogenase iron-sulfur subunit [Proteobacteria bacterium]|nr:hydrogenase iron-sulfur subunit [Pseudomonadota bacterium]
MDKKLAAYICSGCGIGEHIDMEKLGQVASKEYKIPVCRTSECLCGPEGVALIRKDVEAGEANCLAIAACSGRVMHDVFDFPGCLVDRVNLREQVAWCIRPNEELDDPNEDIQMMAEDYLRMGLVKLKKMEPPEPYKPEEEMSKDILVIGGGLSGLTAAKEASSAGYKVILVEKEAELGGFQKKVRQKVTLPYKQVLDNDLPQRVQSVLNDDKITVYTNAKVEKTAGGPCLFNISIRQNGAPPKEGEEAEPAIEHKVGAIVLATGWKPYDPTKLDARLGYGQSSRIITNAVFEETGKSLEKMDNVAFLQCAGSRDPQRLPYCSSICCITSLKHAIQIKTLNPEANVFIVYKELRTPGQAEDLYRAAQEAGVVFIRCQDPEVKVQGDSVTVLAEDELLGETVEIDGLDLVVLATGMVPVTSFGVDVKKKELEAEAEQPKKASDALPVPVDVIRASDCLNLGYRQGPELPDLKYGFPDSHFVCFPYESRRTGIYATGCVRRAMGSASAIEDATGAAMKAIQAVEAISEGRALHPRAGDLSYPEIYLSRCTQCRRCTDECPFGALNEDEKSNPVPVPTRCRRCGICMGACPERIISFKNYSVDMIGAMLKELEMPEEDEEKPRVLIFACENDSYPALDMVGLKRLNYSAYVRIIPLRCLGSLNLVWIADALSTGYDGVMLFGCRHGDDYQCHFVRGSELANIRMSKISETLTRLALEPERIRVEEIGITDVDRIPEIIAEFMETIDEVGPNPFKDL